MSTVAETLVKQVKELLHAGIPKQIIIEELSKGTINKFVDTCREKIEEATPIDDCTSQYFDMLLSDMLSLRHAIPATIRNAYIIDIFHQSAANERISLKQYISELTNCLNDNTELKDILSSYMISFILTKCDKSTLLEEIASLDEKALKQFHSLAYTFTEDDPLIRGNSMNTHRTIETDSTNTPTIIRQLHNMGMSRDEIVDLLCNAMIDTYSSEYRDWGIRSHFSLIGIHDDEYWNELLKTDLEQTLRRQIEYNIDLDKYVIKCIFGSTYPTLLSNSIDLLISKGRERIDQAFCDLLIKQDLDTIDYIEFNIQKFLTSSSLDEETTLKLVKYYIRSCFYPLSDSSQRECYLHNSTHYIHNDEWVYEITIYTRTLLERCTYIDNDIVSELIRYLNNIIAILPRQQSDLMFSNVLSLRHAIPPHLQALFVHTMFSTVTHYISFSTYIKEMLNCISDGIGNIYYLYKYLKQIMRGKTERYILLKELASFDEFMLKQLHELVSILATFNSI